MRREIPNPALPDILTGRAQAAADPLDSAGRISDLLLRFRAGNCRRGDERRAGEAALSGIGARAGAGRTDHPYRSACRFAAVGAGPERALGARPGGRAAADRRPRRAAGVHHLHQVAARVELQPQFGRCLRRRRGADVRATGADGDVDQPDRAGAVRDAAIRPHGGGVARQARADPQPGGSGVVSEAARLRARDHGRIPGRRRRARTVGRPRQRSTCCTTQAYA